MYNNKQTNTHTRRNLSFWFTGGKCKMKYYFNQRQWKRRNDDTFQQLYYGAALLWLFVSRFYSLSREFAENSGWWGVLLCHASETTTHMQAPTGNPQTHLILQKPREKKEFTHLISPSPVHHTINTKERKRL